MKIKQCLLILCLTLIYSVQAKIALISIPKSGTHLVQKIITTLTNKVKDCFYDDIITVNPSFSNSLDYSTKYLRGHFIHTTENASFLDKNNYKAIFIIRDPRDMLISLVHFIYEYPAAFPGISNLPFNHLLSLLIQDMSKLHVNGCFKNNRVLSFKGISNFYNQYLPWINEPFVYTTTFEKLVGIKGGGSDEEQINELQSIARHIGISISNEKIISLAKNLFGGSATFRKGQIGSWKKHFTQEHKKLFKKEAGQLLINLKYEKNLNW